MAELKANNNKSAVLITIDIKKAYDMVTRSKVFKIVYDLCEQSKNRDGAIHYVNCLAEIYNGHK